MSDIGTLSASFCPLLGVVLGCLWLALWDTCEQGISLGLSAVPHSHIPEHGTTLGAFCFSSGEQCDYVLVFICMFVMCGCVYAVSLCECVVGVHDACMYVHTGMYVYMSYVYVCIHTCVCTHVRMCA